MTLERFPSLRSTDGALPGFPIERLAPIVSLSGLVFVWWAVGSTVAPGLPTPPVVAGAFAAAIVDPSFHSSALTSAVRVYVPFLLAAAIAVPIGLLAGWHDPFADLTLPALELVRPIPPIAWIPAVILLIPGTEPGIMFITFLGAFYPILLNAVEGGRSVDREYAKAARSLGADAVGTLRHVGLPGALPSITTGLSVGMGLAWLNLVAAEMLAGGSGLGYLTWSAYTGGSYPYIVVGMLSIGALGVASTAAVGRLDRYLLPWLDSEAGRSA
ncbi:ABC-type nitrate/sulfonate/bicarbonate transport system, permease component [Halalkaliarchaeum desulfuricum]|uniref:ABC-type nitrate/sulfonate/bicarbonate transport system, permease component n=1 Tax=Halalkaliarchaeum desulfuricum TaxID=2055893 RepID=A0A343TIU3_9EURY|nr:ABC transporter permease [Halalkaliarchaeum desulfuricum]AUX09015.1 ABC-type nitrate/sulfonate/bicarbonate transport system, permease component [Halalkaliarchaeum desulfuricum]